MEDEMNNEPTEAELLAEHQAEKAKQEAAEAAKRDEEHYAYLKASGEKHRLERVAMSKHLHEVAKCLPNRLTVVTDDSFSLTIDGVDMTWSYDHIKEQYSQTSSWRSKPNGRKSWSVVDPYRHSMGSNSIRTAFAQHKDGTFNYQEIANRLAAIADKKLAEAKMERQQRSNSKGVAALIKEVFPKMSENSYQNVIAPSSSPDKPVFFTFKIAGTMSIDQARSLASHLRAAGLTLHYSDTDKINAN